MKRQPSSPNPNSDGTPSPAAKYAAKEAAPAPPPPFPASPAAEGETNCDHPTAAEESPSTLEVGTSTSTACCHMSVRATMTVFCIALIVLTAAITLMVTYTFSLSAADRLAQDHAVALAAKAKGDVEGFMQRPVEAIAGAQYMCQRDRWVLPKDTRDGMSTTAFNPESSNALDTPWFRRWWQWLAGQMAAASFAYQFAVFGFNDGNYAGCKLLSTSVFQCRVFSMATRSVTGSSALYQENYNISTYQLVGNSSGTTSYDPRTRSWWTAVPHVQNAMEWTAVYLSAMPTLPIVDINAAMYNATGDFLGVASFTFELKQLSSLLHSLKTTPNTVLVLIDNDLGLLATTKEDTIPFMSQTIYANRTTIPSSLIPPGCIASDLSNGASVPMVVCRTNITTYPYRALNELYNEKPEMFKGNTGADVSVQLLTLSGERYYVTVASVQTPRAPRGMGWRVVLLMPEMDVIGPIVSGRNLSIGIASGLLVFFSLLAFVMISVVLSPLESLARRMYLAATFQTESEDGEELSDLCARRIAGFFTEVKTIQEAFLTLTGELTKVKSYLPASVLAALYGDDEEDEGDEEGVAASEKSSELATQSSFATHRSATVANLSAQQSTVTGSVVAGVPISSVALGRRTSNQSMASTAPRAPQGLNTTLKLQAKKVTVLAVNVASFHQTAQRAGSSEELLRIHGRIVDLVSNAAKDTKGVVDGFHGDRFMITFNAVTTVGNHATAACNCALALTKLFKVEALKGGAMQHLQHGVTCGIASSSALVGNMGSNTLKRFCVIGSCTAQATAMERLCRLYTPRPISTLLCGQAIFDVENFFDVMMLDVVAFPSTIPFVGVTSSASTAAMKAPPAKPTKVAVLCGLKSVQCDEWMYQLQEGSSGSLYKVLNDAFEDGVWAPLQAQQAARETSKQTTVVGRVSAKEGFTLHDEALLQYTRRPVGEGEDPTLHALSCVVAARLRKLLLASNTNPHRCRAVLHAELLDEVTAVQNQGYLPGGVGAPRKSIDEVKPFHGDGSKKEGEGEEETLETKKEGPLDEPLYCNRLVDYYWLMCGGDEEMVSGGESCGPNKQPVRG